MRKRCVRLIPKPSVVTRVSSAESGLRCFSCMRIYLEMLTNLHAMASPDFGPDDTWTHWSVPALTLATLAVVLSRAA